eukprot:4964084-Pyramimonas_sp.AAC.1
MRAILHLPPALEWACPTCALRSGRCAKCSAFSASKAALASSDCVWRCFSRRFSMSFLAPAAWTSLS